MTPEPRVEWGGGHLGVEGDLFEFGVKGEPPKTKERAQHKHLQNTTPCTTRCDTQQKAMHSVPYEDIGPEGEKRGVKRRGRKHWVGSGVGRWGNLPPPRVVAPPPWC